MSRTCKSCRWWQRAGSESMGECRRFPPPHTYPVRTDFRFFCGEHEHEPAAALAPATAPTPQPETFRPGQRVTMKTLEGDRADRIRQLEKAAALCIAEIERIKRLHD